MELNQPKLLTVRTMGLLLLLTALLGLSADGYDTMPGYTGENVTLTCPDSSCNTRLAVAVVKRKNGSGGHAFSYCIDGHAMRPKHQDRSFEGRVEGINCPMKDSNVSVTLTNLTKNDTGYYEWVVINNGTSFNYTVYLNVTDRDAADGDNRTGDHVNRNTTSGNTTDAGAIAGGVVAGAAVVAVVAGIVMIIVHLCGCKRYTIPCIKDKQQTSDLPVTYNPVYCERGAVNSRHFHEGLFYEAFRGPSGNLWRPLKLVFETLQETRT